MSEYFKSYRIFTAFQTSRLLKRVLIVIAVEIVLVIGLSVAMNESMDFVSGMLSSLAVCMFPMLNSVFLYQIYNYNMPATPGYKYFHSVCNSAEHFRRAIILSNIMALAATAVAVGLAFLIEMFVHEGIEMTLTVSIGLGLMLPGVINLLSFSKNATVRMLSMAAGCCFVGFLFGISTGLEEDGISIIWIVLGLTAVLYILGFVLSALFSKKRWCAEL